MSVIENLIVAYENAEHQRYTELLLSFGFDMRLSHDFKIGRRYVHPLKGHVVRLDYAEDSSRPQECYEPHFAIKARPSAAMPQRQDYDTPLWPEHYSDLEWQWLTRNNPTHFELLSRELYIWFKVRPHSLNTLAITGNGAPT